MGRIVGVNLVILNFICVEENNSFLLYQCSRYSWTLLCILCSLKVLLNLLIWSFLQYYAFHSSTKLYFDEWVNYIFILVISIDCWFSVQWWLRIWSLTSNSHRVRVDSSAKIEKTENKNYTIQLVSLVLTSSIVCKGPLPDVCFWHMSWFIFVNYVSHAAENWGVISVFLDFITEIKNGK